MGQDRDHRLRHSRSSYSLRKYHQLPLASVNEVEGKESQYDKLADLVRRHVDMPGIYRTIEEGIDE